LYLEALVVMLAHGALTPWERAFIAGCERHHAAGRGLTEKQAAVLKTIRERAQGRGTASA